MLLTDSEVSYNIIKNAVAICPASRKGLEKTKHLAFRLKFSRISNRLKVFYFHLE